MRQAQAGRTFEAPLWLRCMMWGGVFVWLSFILMFAWVAISFGGAALFLLGFVIAIPFAVGPAFYSHGWRVVIDPDGLAANFMVGRPLHLPWHEIRVVRQFWTYGGLIRTIHIIPKRGRRIVLADQHIKGFDELLSLILDSIPEEKVDRRAATIGDRLLRGQYVPHRDEERRILTPTQRKRLTVAVIVSVVFWLLLWNWPMLRDMP